MRARSNGTGQRSCAASARVERGRRAFRVAARRRENPAATSRSGQAPRNLRALGLSLEPRRQPVGPRDVADSDCGFDSICFDSPNGRLSESDLLEPSPGALEVAIGRFSFPGGELDGAERAQVEHVDDRLLPLRLGGKLAHTLELAEVRVEVRLPDLGRGGDAELHGGLTQRGHHLLGHSHLAGPQLDQQLIQQDVQAGSLVAFVDRGPVRLAEVLAGGSELVHVPEPLSESVDHPVVDRRGRVVRSLFELERPVGCRLVEAVPEEEVCANAVRESEGLDCGIGIVALFLQQLERGLGGRQSSDELMCSCPTGENRVALRLQHGSICSVKRFARNRSRCAFTRALEDHPGQEQQGPCLEITCGKRGGELLEQPRGSVEVAGQMEVLCELQLALAEGRRFGRRQPHRELAQLGGRVGCAASPGESCRRDDRLRNLFVGLPRRER